MQDTWNPEQYDRFLAERSRPFYDLVALIQPKANLRILDLGCGTGALTKYLHETLAAHETIGLDASANMLEKAHPFTGDGLRFTSGQIEGTLPDGAFDLIVSNAALQWVPKHRDLLTNFKQKLRPGGQLAIQIPAMDNDPVHTLAAETARDFSQPLHGYVHQFEVLLPEQYAHLLYQLGFVEQTVRLQLYGHVLPSREAVLDWYRGSLLTDYQRRLDAATFEQFVARYWETLCPYLNDDRPFFFPYKRILMWGRLD
ncbi:MAG: methyltransferase domain-containing protein [Stenomitos rutilans HA7619-LM2]|jgi:trans-aconitate 2-methyltransferase|nr:methyltransferase domain-containing protein [Stenomitos rutilans HA7619-LM2]